MRIGHYNNATAVQCPNLDFGYETSIKLPFHFSRLSNGKLASYDEGFEYDMYSVKGSVVVPPEILGYMGGFSDEGRRGGRYFITQLRSGGFYPFTPALTGIREYINESVMQVIDDRFYVAFNKVDVKGKADIFARAFRVDMEMMMVTEGGSLPAFYGRSEGAPTEGTMAIDLFPGGNPARVEGIRHPVNGFDVSVSYDAYPRQMPGGGYASANYAFLQSRARESRMVITANTGTATNLLNALLTHIRLKTFLLRAPRNYAVFGSGDYQSFAVKIASDEIRVKHTRFDEFEIALNLRMEQADG